MEKAAIDTTLYIEPLKYILPIIRLSSIEFLNKRAVWEAKLPQQNHESVRIKYLCLLYIFGYGFFPQFLHLQKTKK